MNTTRVRSRYRVEGLLEVVIQTKRQARSTCGHAGNAARVQQNERTMSSNLDTVLITALLNGSHE